jgi:predicted transcriptional regulator
MPVAEVFRPARSGAGAVLGPLEGAIMEVIWRSPGSTSVPQVHDALSADGRVISYSAVKAVLNNLAGKGHLTKTRAGKMTFFEAVQSREGFDNEVVASVVGSLKRNFGVPVIAQLVEELAVDEATLAEFERVVAARRKALKP